MFESWALISILLIVAVLFGAAIRYMATVLFRPNLRKKEDDLIKGNIAQIDKILREIEAKVGIGPKDGVINQRLEPYLQNIEKRLSAILPEIKEPEVESPSSGQAEKGAVPVLDESGKEIIVLTGDDNTKEEIPVAIGDEDDKNWNNFEKWQRERENEAKLDLSDSPDPERKLTELYNNAIENRELRDALWQEFHITQIENINAVDQRLENKVEPEFKQSDSGNFYAIDKQAEREFWVVPKFDFTVKLANYESTIKFMFDCDNFDENSSYSHVRVLRPAIFVKSGEIWKPETKGLLLLRQ